MNQLNSVIVEGTITKLTKSTSLNRDSMVKFNLVSKRFSKDPNGFSHCEESNIPIVCYDEMAKTLTGLWPDKLKSVRVVGRLKEAADYRLYIVAEHVDVKPVPKAGRSPTEG